MKNTGVEAQYLRVGDRIQLFDHEGKAAGYATVTVPPYTVGPKGNQVVVHVRGNRAKSRRTEGSQVFRRSEYVVVEWRPGIHERDLERNAS